MHQPTKVFGNFSDLWQRNLFAEQIMEPIVNFREPFSCGIHFQNRFLEPV